MAGLSSGAVALAVVGGVAAPAAGHSAFTGSTPADGSVVAVPPTAVDLTFTEPPLAIGTQVQVTGPDGQVVNDGDVVRSAATVTQPLADELPAGQYEVVWRVTSADGHPISGQLSFTAEAPSAAAVDAPARGSAPGADSAAGLDIDPEPDVEPETGLDDPALGEDAEGWDAVPWVVGVVGVVGVVVLVVAGVAFWATRRRGSAGRHGCRAGAAGQR